MNTEIKEEPLANVADVYPGAQLKYARESLGWTEDQVAGCLKLRVSVIREIEQDSCSDKQLATFTRGYIRSYAKLVGLDAEALLIGYTSAPKPDEVAQKMQSFSRKTRRERHDNRVMNLTWVILSVVLGITSVWWWQNQQNTPASSGAADADQQDQVTAAEFMSTLDRVSQAPAASQAPAEPAKVTTQDAVATPTDVALTSAAAQPAAPSAPAAAVVSPPASASVKTAAVAVTRAPAVTSTAPVTTATLATSASANTAPASTQAASASAAAKQSQLSMVFGDDCWVDIRDGSGKRLVTGIKSAGEKIELTGDAPFKVVLGAPSAVTLTFNGNNVNLSKYPEGRVARLSLPQQ